MIEQWWEARWIDPWGNMCELFFSSFPLRHIARIDFALKCQEQGIACPREYTLEETTQARPAMILRSERDDQ